jgi:hypothetical protein
MNRQTRAQGTLATHGRPLHPQDDSSDGRETSLEKEFECPLSLELLNRPVTLPCCGQNVSKNVRGVSLNSRARLEAAERNRSPWG